MASVIALRSIGKGYSAARKLFAILNLSPPVHQRHWSSYNDKLEQESQQLVKNNTTHFKNCYIIVKIKMILQMLPLLFMFRGVVKGGLPLLAAWLL